MISVEEALILAVDYYPKAPEKIIETLEIEVLFDDSMTSDGWVFQYKDDDKGINRTLITINSSLSPVRQRFTLAHELAHVILGITPVVGEKISLNYSKMSDEERAVNSLAAQLLIPTPIVLKNFKVPITAKDIRGFARLSRVSEIAVALRIVTLSKDLGLKHAIVTFYSDDLFKWYQSETLRFDDADDAQEYLRKCLANAPNVVREPFEDGVIVASLLENPSFNTKTIFLQVVDESDGRKELPEERIRDLQSQIFDGNFTLQQSMNARLGSFKNKSLKMTLDEAVSLFYKNIFKYPDQLIEDNVELVNSELMKEYVRLKLENWRNS